MNAELLHRLTRKFFHEPDGNNRARLRLREKFNLGFMFAHRFKLSAVKAGDVDHLGKLVIVDGHGGAEAILKLELTFHILVPDNVLEQAWSRPKRADSGKHGQARDAMVRVQFAVWVRQVDGVGVTVICKQGMHRIVKRFSLRGKLRVLKMKKHDMIGRNAERF